MSSESDPNFTLSPIVVSAEKAAFGYMLGEGFAQGLNKAVGVDVANPAIAGGIGITVGILDDQLNVVSGVVNYINNFYMGAVNNFMGTAPM